jgi:hypothetical protein
MDAFSYLSVLLSIIVGLAITQVLSGYRALMLARSRVILHAPTLIWSVLVLLFAVQMWWASFGLADHDRWTFLSFFILLLQTVLLYMLAALVLPDMPSDQRTDLRAHYVRETTPFFLTLLGILAISLAKDRIIDGHLPGAYNLAFHGLFAATAIAALLIRRPLFHEILAPANALLFLTYIGLLFARL